MCAYTRAYVCVCVRERERECVCVCHSFGYRSNCCFLLREKAPFYEIESVKQGSPSATLFNFSRLDIFPWYYSNYRILALVSFPHNPVNPETRREKKKGKDGRKEDKNEKTEKLVFNFSVFWRSSFSKSRFALDFDEIGCLICSDTWKKNMVWFIIFFSQVVSEFFLIISFQ